MRHRKLIILDSICIVVIIVAIVVRISESYSKNSLSSAVLANTRSIANKIVLAVDSEFYKTSESVSSSTKSVLDQKPGILVKTPTEIAKPSGPSVTAISYLVGNVATGEIFLKKNKSTILPVASMSKLITAIAATDAEPAATMVGITEAELNVPPDASGLFAGEKMKISELLYPLLLNSSNVAAEALASSSNRTKFLTTMSSYSWEIGMPSTFFADPSGVSPQNVSTARDFFALAQYLYLSRPDILAITRTTSQVLASTTDHGHHDFTNIHPFVNNPSFLGGKTGHTVEARDTMLTIMKIANKPIAIVILASDNRKKDTEVLIATISKLLNK